MADHELDDSATHDTPYSKANYSSHQQGSLRNQLPGNLPQCRKGKAQDMTNKSIGEDTAKFAERYFPLPPTSDPSTSSSKPSVLVNPFEKLKNANSMSEKKLQDTFVRIINQHKLAPGLKMGTCESRPDSAQVDPDRQKIDAAFWREEVAPSDKMPHWIDQLIPVEFKAWRSGGSYQDPYYDKPSVPGGVALSEYKVPTKNFGQIISYAEVVFTVQQRLAVFMLVVVGRTCRILRWDHAGAVVTQSIDYYKHWKVFCDILWRISQSSNTKLGVDPSALRLSNDDEDFETMNRLALPNPEDIEDTEGALATPPKDSDTFSYVRTMFRESLDEQWPRYKLEVPCGETTRHFLVCKPVFHAKGLIGRGTRGYVALDCESGRFVWLKDAWRAYYLLLEKEGDILADLKTAGVPNIPTVVCHGDIRDHMTHTSQIWELKHPEPSSDSAAGQSSASNSDRPHASSSSSTKRKWDDVDDSGVHIPPPKGLNEASVPFRDDCPLRLHRHYRLVVQEVAKPVHKFATGEQLVSIVYDCVWAHYQAFEKTRRLHRDVSAGNVLMYPQLIEVEGTYHLKWMGLLADWEMSKVVENEPAKRRQRQPERTGTWQYLSVALLSRDKPVEISDELEAFFYVLLYHAIRYLRSNVDNYTTANYLDQFFDQYTVIDGGGYGCGTQKRSAISDGKLMVTGDLELRFDRNMDDLILMLLSWFRANRIVDKYLQDVKEEERRQRMQKKKQAHMPPPPPPPPLPPSADQAPGSSAHPAPQPRKRILIKRSPVFRSQLGGTELNDDTRQLVPPSQKYWDDSKKVQVHGFMCTLLERFLEREWPQDDKVGDRIPKTWVRAPLGSTAQPTTSAMTSNKRMRYGRMDGVNTVVFPLSQPRPPISPSKNADSVSDKFWRKFESGEGESLPQ